MSDEDIVKDSNGTVLNDGDSVSVIKDLKVKGSNSGLKRGTIIKNISLNYGAVEAIECSGQFRGISIKAEYVKKA